MSLFTHDYAKGMLEYDRRSEASRMDGLVFAFCIAALAWMVIGWFV